MGKFSFVLGAGLGYVLGTRAGRGQFEKIKRMGSDAWQNPRVQSGVQKAEDRIGDMARQQGSAVTDRVAGIVKDRINGNRGGPERPMGYQGPMDPSPPPQP